MPPPIPNSNRRARRRPRNDATVIITPFWDDEPNTWDYVAIHDKRFFCGTSFPEATVGRKSDVKSPAGSDGASITDKGYEPAQVRFTVKLLTRQHLQDWEALVPVIHPKRRVANRQPINVYHPVLEHLGIRQVYVQKVGALKASGEHGIQEATIETIEFAEITPKPTRRVTPPAAPSIEQIQSVFGGNLSALEQERAREQLRSGDSPSLLEEYWGPD